MHLNSEHEPPAVSVLFQMGNHALRCSKVETLHVYFTPPTIFPLRGKSPLAPAGTIEKKMNEGDFIFIKCNPSLWQIFKNFPLKILWWARGSIRHISNVSELTATNGISQRCLCSSDLAEMFFFCKIKILQKPCRGLYVCQRCFFQMLKAPNRGLGSFLLCIASQRWSGWMRCHSKWGRFSKANLHPPHSAKKIYSSLTVHQLFHVI